MSNTSIFALFDNNQLTSVNGLSVLATDPYKQPKRKVTITQIARTNKNKLNSAFYNAKNITVRVCINRRTRDDVEQSIDQLNAILQGLEKDLVLAQSGSVRRYVATYSDCVVRMSGGAYWEADLVFTLSDNFGYDTSYTQIVNNIVFTSSTRNDQYNFGGSADWQCPVISILFSALTGGAGASVVIGNAATGQQLTITRTWAAGDYLEIDTLNETVKVNGVEVASTGAFPRFAVGLGNLTYSDTLTTRTGRYNAYYYKRYV